jgi:hypothetical protein
LGFWVFLPLNENAAGGRNGLRPQALAYVTKADPVNPKLLRQYARDCERMARERVDLFTQEALAELAVEFRRAAKEIESGKSTGTRPRERTARYERLQARPLRGRNKERAVGGPARRGFSSAR